MNRLANAFKNTTRTENGALTYKSTLSPVVDFFAIGAALRTRPENEVLEIISKAFDEDPLITLRTLFYFRDVRGGQGERRLFRVALKWLAQNHTEVLEKNLAYVPFFGRWDDLLILVGSKLEAKALMVIEKQFRNDLVVEYPSLLGKWMPSENTSSKATRALAKTVRSFMGYTPKQYRKALSRLRFKIQIVERLMCSREFAGIDYSKVPSNASLKYRKAFTKRDGERYGSFIASVKKGESKINASTLYPYDLVHQVFHNRSDDTVDLQWKALPDYFEGKETNGLVVTDVSGSMIGRPIEVSISLAMYVAERNKGPFHNMFMTFSSHPEIQEIRGNTLAERVQNLAQASWNMSTNLQAAFNKILATAEQARATQEEMPDTLYIVSDMEFDSCVSSRKSTNFEEMKDKYRAAGYKLPKVVFWNVNSRNNQQPVTFNEEGVMLVSGCSPAILKSVLKGDVRSPLELVLQTVNAPRYQVIQV